MKAKLSSYFRHSMTILFVALNVIPLLWILRTAFVDKQYTLDLFRLVPPTLANFKNVFASAPFATYFLNTFLIITGIFCVQFVLVTLAAYAFARLDFYGKNILFVLFLMQILITPDVLIIPNYSFLSQLNLVDTRLGIMIPYFASGFGVFLLRQTFKQIPYELEEAARVEGMSTWGIIWRIYVPLSKPSYIAFAIVSISYHWNNFLWPLVVTNSVEHRTLSLGLAIFAQTYETGAQWADVCAATVAVIAPLLILFFIFGRKIMESFTSSGLK
ncbi:carbohydrate ABC transporter permease [Desulfosporosinus sp. FKA]|uniref:carbohydrate ABC transporter permease n=1 Tax=Desulfosporosinus sp. FKA TaxID=1969834 RepID=UPI001A9A64C2|nr:carbohydrate ABC transporter permease [Desulfosporosinus sp. FKA]